MGHGSLAGWFFPWRAAHDARLVVEHGADSGLQSMHSRYNLRAWADSSLQVMEHRVSGPSRCWGLGRGAVSGTTYRVPSFRTPGRPTSTQEDQRLGIDFLGGGDALSPYWAARWFGIAGLARAARQAPAQAAGQESLGMEQAKTPRLIRRRLMGQKASDG